MTAAATSSRAETQTWPCDAVDVLAEAIGDTSLISVNVFGSKKTKRCQFHINMVTKGASKEVEEAVKAAIPNLRYLRNYARDIVTKDVLTAEERKKFPSVIKKINEDFVYLLALAGLDEGFPPKKLRDIVNAEKTLFTDCFALFYSGGDPELKGKHVSCNVDRKKGKTLESFAGYENVSYQLYTFR